jgi:integrase/recombinase XerD
MIRRSHAGSEECLDLVSNKKHGVSLKQYRKVDDRWQFMPVIQKNGLPDPKFIRLDGKVASSKGGGAFYIDYRDPWGKRRRKPVGNSPIEALDAWKLQMGIKRGDIEPDPADVPKPETNKGKTIDDAIKDYLVEVKATKGDKTLLQYSRELKWFRSICVKTYVSELNRSDAMDLFAVGRELVTSEGFSLNQKTINRRVIIMLNAMRSQGAVIEMKKGDWPKTIDKKIEVYQPEELSIFFGACDLRNRTIFQTFLNTGFRDREVRFLMDTDINPRVGTASVTAKPAMTFKPKSYEERTVLIPLKLVDLLKQYKRTSHTSTLQFPTAAHPTRKFAGGKPDGRFLERCKKIAFKAGLNCGRCTGFHTVYVMRDGVTRRERRPHDCAIGPFCTQWNLHKFRHTFATQHVHDGVDVRSLQKMLGHKHLSTTEKYLEGQRMDKLRDRIENSTLASLL